MIHQEPSKCFVSKISVYCILLMIVVTGIDSFSGSHVEVCDNPGLAQSCGMGTNEIGMSSDSTRTTKVFSVQDFSILCHVDESGYMN